MKMLKTTFATGLALGAALLTAALAPGSAFAHGDDHDKGHHKGGHKDQHVTVTVDGKGYHPAMVKVKAGEEVHMTFMSKGEGCANGVRIPSLHKSLDLKHGQKQEVTFTPKKGQTIAFACKMNMFKGKVLVK